MIKLISDSWKDRGLSEEIWNALSKRYYQLRDYTNTIEESMFRPPFLYQTARSLIKILNEVKNEGLPRQEFKTILRTSKEIERLVGLYDLTMASSRITSMAYQTQILRDYFNASMLPKDNPKTLQLYDLNRLVRNVVNNLEPAAKKKGVEPRLKIERFSARVRIVERDIYRALTNIMHNAIKYSYILPAPRSAWIDIKCFINQGYWIASFESWGVPIKEEEIKQRLIFQRGYRGVFASDGGRLGTG